MRVGIHEFSFHNPMNVARPDDLIVVVSTLPKNVWYLGPEENDNDIPCLDSVRAKAKVMMSRCEESSV